MPNSLFGRLILASMVLLAFFFSFIAYFTVEVFTNNTEEAIEASLVRENNVLRSLAQVQSNKIVVTEEYYDPRLNQYESGYYAFVSDGAGHILWQSYSAHSLELDKRLLMPDQLGVGENRFVKDEQYYRYQHAVMWEVITDNSQLIVFTVLEDKSQTLAKIADFRRQIGKWLAITAIVLIFSLLLILLWGTLPLRIVAKRLKLIERGMATSIDGNFPIELRRLTENLNQLIKTERKQRERYHATLADLAHSLKTPLAVIQAEIELHGKDDGAYKTLKQQTARIDDIIKHQLQRAVVSSPHTLTEAIDVASCVDKIKVAFEKIYRDKEVALSIDVSSEAIFRGDQRDLMEVLGNLLDNAFKACHQQVALKSYKQGEYLYIEVHDDGEGVSKEDRNFILKRGLRADLTGAGQGIGLDVVRDIVSSYKGKVEIEDSELGGALFMMSFKVMS